jgi:hypothetical protein
MIQWTKDSFHKEREEFLRVVKRYNEPDNVNDAMEYLSKQYTASQMVLFQDRQWAKLENSGSLGTSTLAGLFKNLKRDGVRRDISNLFSMFVGKGKINDMRGRVSAPIVLQRADKGLELIAGNTRLTMANIMGVRPKVVIIRTDW